MPSIETHLHDYIKERVAACGTAAAPLVLPASIPLREPVRAAISATIRGLEVLPDEFAQIRSTRGVRVGEAIAHRVAPSFDGTELEHFDAVVVLIVYLAVARVDRSAARASYREEVLAISNALGVLILAEPDLRRLAEGTPRVNNSRPLSVPRGSDNVDGQPYAVANVQLVVNESGDIDFRRRL